MATRPAAAWVRVALLISAALASSEKLAAQGDLASDSEARQAVATLRANLKRERWTELEQSLRALAEQHTKGVQEVLLEHLDRLPPSHLKLARRRLVSEATPTEREALLGGSGLRSSRATLRAQVLRALGEGLPRDLDWTSSARALLDDPAPRVRAAAVYALGRARMRRAKQDVAACALDPSAEVRAAVPASLARLMGKRAVPTLGALLQDEASWRVRAAAARALGELRTEDAARLLLNRLIQEPGRVREDLVVGLEQLTGRRMGLTAEPWRRWDEARPGLPLLSELAIEDEPYGELPENEPVLSYFGIPSLSQALLLGTDLSSSMNVVDPRRYGQRMSGRPTRLRVTRNELSGFLTALEPPVRFALVGFEAKVDDWRRKLTLADERGKQEALFEIDHYKAAGETDLFAFLEHVFDLAERQLHEAGGDDAQMIDTVYLLTDGAPTSGGMVKTSLLQAYVHERNRTLGLRFHCIALTAREEHNEFLESIAVHSGGRSFHPLR